MNTMGGYTNSHVLSSKASLQRVSRNQ